MKLGIVLNTNDAESVWNAFRLANASLKENRETTVFLLGKAVECENIQKDDFDVQKELNSFKESNGRLLACGTCLRLREQKTKVCSVSSMQELLELVKESDKLISLG
ncbi:TPA: DsrE family protein [Candidatus Micrarchaeota archaeon]|nr:DsrE family protein [Candidatus Micrarchaeota archaeon]